jgi:hypothetical protein
MTELPEWVATLVGTLVLENHAMRRALAEAAPKPPAEPSPPQPG